MAAAPFDGSEEAFKRKVENLLLYPPLAELGPIFRILEALAEKERWYLEQIFDIGGEMETFEEAWRGEEILRPTNLAEFKRSDSVTLSDGLTTLETSALLLACSIFSSDSLEAAAPPTPCAVAVRTEFWKAASRLSARELFLLVEAAKNKPRMPVDLEALQEALEKVARRHGIDLEGGARGEER